ncbi:hypothetical protein FXN63_17030 [Pigmentiphaga aceris]|uniref:Uncharacterized protein n=1 Tax=Pigmentiphaga aceris TaxID=1940612 RepID=A0A5C0B073_9BURK|nr:hypothetical protein [Pigmentiphaga aceris]QEI07356.1 hypothetical protein FXN63_17030 [Pigmentiphaga aceris]
MARFQMPASSANYPFAAGYLPQSFIQESRLTDDMERSLAHAEVRSQIYADALPFQGIARAFKAWIARGTARRTANA